MRLAHVQLAAPPGCEPEARRVYGGLLGLEEVPKPEPLAGRGGVWFTLGDQQLHIGGEDPFVAARKAPPAFKVEDLDGLAGRREQVSWDDALPGGRRFYAEDPFGNRLEFLD